MGIIDGCCLGFIAIFFPPIAPALRTGCDHHLLINILLTILGWLPGVFHAWYIILRFPSGRPKVVRKERVIVQEPPRQAHQAYYPPPPQQETGHRTY